MKLAPWSIVALLAWALTGCDSGPQTLGWFGAASDEPTPLPWFGGPSYYEPWSRGIAQSPSFFPIGVWMQNPLNVARFQAVGVNHYVGLWQGPSAEQYEAALAADLPVVCEQAGVWQQHLDSPIIQGWLQADGPDNAQENADGSYGPCIEPAATRARYAEMVAADATRPVMLLLGQGVATPDWVGRGSCAGRTEDYPEYVRGADLLVNYTYPLANAHPLELVATGIDNLNRYANYQKPVIADLEASNINGDARPTPHQIRAQVWMSLIHGAAGVQYFCHRFAPDFSETDCLDDPDTAAALTRIGQELASLAPALNSQSYAQSPVSRNPSVPVHAVFKRPGKSRYVFAAGMANGVTTASFSLRGLGAVTNIEVLGEGRSITPTGDSFEDAFEAYGVHLYALH